MKRKYLLPLIFFIIFIFIWWSGKSTVEKWLFLNGNEVSKFALASINGIVNSNVPKPLEQTSYLTKDGIMMIMFYKDYDLNTQNYSQVLYFLPTGKEKELVETQLQKEFTLKRLEKNWYLMTKKR